ncbi:hypothetical protein RchiOBHm_Chr6g0307771 [Rosa chinensis]|uniref:Uncharacterized protein n=1 Tax=Rosa chinensis TaxID=74649 RepID=A0A2P6Q0H2_ROSCH|nr:hypothetical protein RchiOBHm_Chr6g0307771 [Rosa chinensis]
MKVKFPKCPCYYSNSDHSPKSHWLRSTSTISLAVAEEPVPAYPQTQSRSSGGRRRRTLGSRTSSAIEAS